jgi:hypothetical protein
MGAGGAAAGSYAGSNQLAGLLPSSSHQRDATTNPEATSSGLLSEARAGEDALAWEAGRGAGSDDGDEHGGRQDLDSRGGREGAAALDEVAFEALIAETRRRKSVGGHELLPGAAALALDGQLGGGQGGGSGFTATARAVEAAAGTHRRPLAGPRAAATSAAALPRQRRRGQQVGRTDPGRPDGSGLFVIGDVEVENDAFGTIMQWLHAKIPHTRGRSPQHAQQEHHRRQQGGSGAGDL